MRETLDRQLYLLDLSVDRGCDFSPGAPLAVPAEGRDVRPHALPHVAGRDHPLGCSDAGMGNGVNVVKDDSPETGRDHRSRVGSDTSQLRFLPPTWNSLIFSEVEATASCVSVHPACASASWRRSRAARCG